MNRRVNRIDELARDIPPARDLWPAIAAAIEADRAESSPPVAAGRRRNWLPAAGLAAQRGEHCFDDRGAAVEVQLSHVLARLGPRGREEKDQRLIQHFAGLRVADAAEGGDPILGPRRRQRVNDLAGARSADAHDRDPRPPGSARKGKDCGGLSHAST